MMKFTQKRDVDVEEQSLEDRCCDWAILFVENGNDKQNDKNYDWSMIGQS